mgnify:CR=1 FL=1
MKYELSSALRREYFRQQSPVVLVKAQNGSKTAKQRELEVVAKELADAFEEETGNSPLQSEVAIVTDAWGSKIAALGIWNGQITWAWDTPASRQDRDYLYLAFDLLQSMHPTLLVNPDQEEMMQRLAAFFLDNPHRKPGRDEYERTQGRGDSPFATLSVNGQMG